MLASVIFGQSSDDLQTIVLKGGLKDKVFIFFTIEYPQLTFIRSGNKFKASATFSVEVYDSTMNLYRDKKTKEVFVENYKQTKLPKELGFLFYVDLPTGDYFLKSTLYLNNESSLVTFPTKKINGTSSIDYIPYLVLKDNINNGKGKVVSLGDYYPLNNETNTLVFLTNTDLTDANLVVKQFGNVIFKGKLSFDSLKFINLHLSDGELFAQFQHGISELNTYQSVGAFSKLIPGKASIFIDNGKSTFHRNINVYWKHKPKIFNNWDAIVEVMSFVFPEKEIKKLKNSNSKTQMRDIFSVWAKYDDDSTTAYNPLMDEFFRRVDYADEHFSVSKKLRGYLTDRGKIFIQNGKPFNIKRDFTDLDFSREIWSYGNRKFIFIDKRGLGEYKLSGVK